MTDVFTWIEGMALVRFLGTTSAYPLVSALHIVGIALVGTTVPSICA